MAWRCWRDRATGWRSPSPAGAPAGSRLGLQSLCAVSARVSIAAPTPFDPAALAAWLRDQRPDIVAGPPVPLLAAARVAAHDGGAPLRVRAVLLSSDHVAASLARGLADAWGADVFRHWGMTETGFGGAVDCAFHCGCHLREDELLVEVVDPATGSTAPPGACGEVVVSTLRRRATPLLRYRTGDLARLLEAPCACGSALRRLDGFAGRVGSGAALASGDELTLPRLDEALFAVDGVCDFAAVVENGAPPTLWLAVAAPQQWRVGAALAAIRVRLAEDAVIARALAAGALALEIGFANGLAASSGSKRKLTIRETAQCALRC